MVVCGRCLVWPSGILFLLMCVEGSGCDLCVCFVCSSVIAKTLLLLEHQWMGLMHGLTNSGNWLCTQGMCDVWGLSSLSEVCPRRLVYLFRPPFGCSSYAASQLLLCCGLVPASVYVGFVALEMGSLVDQGQPLPMIAQVYLLRATKQSTGGCCLCWTYK